MSDSLEKAPRQIKGIGEKEFAVEMVTCQPRLLDYAGKLTGGDSALSEDMVQATFIKMWKSRKKFRVGTKMISWATTILTNTVRDYFSHRNVQRENNGPQAEIDINTTANLDADLGEAFDMRRVATKINDAIEVLPPRQQETIDSVVGDGMTYSAAAAKRGLTRGTISKQMSDLRAMLKTLNIGQEALDILGAKKPEKKIRSKSDDNPES